MYYVKIPLRNLCEPHELKVSEDNRDALWRERVTSLLGDLRGGVIPAWAVNYEDLRTIELEKDDH